MLAEKYFDVLNSPIYYFDLGAWLIYAFFFFKALYKPLVYLIAQVGLS